MAVDSARLLECIISPEERATHCMLNLSPERVLMGHSSGLYLTPTCSWGFLAAATSRVRQSRMSERKSILFVV